MLYNIKVVYLHCVFHGIRFKVNEDWVSGKIPFFFLWLMKKRGRCSMNTALLSLWDFKVLSSVF